VDVARVGDDGRWLRAAEARDADPVGWDHRCGHAPHDAGNEVDLRQDDVGDGLQVEALGLQEHVPRADDGDGAPDALLRAEPGQDLGHRAGGDPEIHVRVHGLRVRAAEGGLKQRARVLPPA
jgi:hypothetical protein